MSDESNNGGIIAPSTSRSAIDWDTLSEAIGQPDVVLPEGEDQPTSPVPTSMAQKGVSPKEAMDALEASESGKVADEEESEGEAPQEEETVEAASGQTEDEAQAEEDRYLEFYNGDEVIKLPENAEFKMRADGKEIKISAKDLRDHKAGQIAWDRKFTEASKKEKILQSEKEQLISEKDGFRSQLEEMAKLANEGNGLDALEVIGELMSQEDPTQFAQGLLGSFSKFFQQFEGMNPEQVQGYFLQKRNDSLQRRMKRQAENASKQQTDTQLKMQYEQAKREHEFTDDDFEVAVQAIQQQMGKPREEITMVEAVEAINGRFLMEDIIDSAEEVGVALTDSQRMEAFHQLRTARQQGQMKSYEDLKTLMATYKESLADERTTENLNRKVAKAPLGQKAATPPKAVSGPMTPESWEELDRLYDKSY